MSQKNIETAEKSAAILAALGNPKRVLIMQHLLAEEVPVNELARRVELSQSAISQHLARLREADLVETRRDRQTIYYSSSREVVRKIFALLDRELS